MAEELQFSSRPDNKRKFDDSAGAPPSSAARRPTGFSAPVASLSPDNSTAGAAPQPSYNSVAPQPDGIELAKQRAQEIAARLVSNTEAKRPRAENGGAADDSSEKGFFPTATDQLQKPLGQQIPSQVEMAPSTTFPPYGYTDTNRKIEIPSGRVGRIIGKGGDTIRQLQMQSGARIQVTRDMDADPNSQTRIVELMGTSEQINKAEQLIKDALSEAEAGGSGIAAARRLGGFQVGSEQFTIRVPNDKVGLIIGKGGEMIKSMQARSGAHIQIIPLHLPPGDTSTERTVQIDGTSEQIESAKQLVNEIISGNRPRLTGGYPQQVYRPPWPPMSWGPPGQPPIQQPGYGGYMQPGAYPGLLPQYNNMSQLPYGGYTQPPSSSGWDQSSNPPAQQTTLGTGYDSYNQQQPQQQTPPPPGASVPPADNTGYNYGQPPSYNSQGSYGDPAYTQSATTQQQGYGHENYSGGYNAPAAQPGYSQPTSYPQGGYDHQQGYSSAPAYGSVAYPTQDASTTTYGVQAAPTQSPPAQPSPTQQGYAGQTPSTTPASYPSQGTAPPGYSASYSSQGTAPPGYSASYPSQGTAPPGYGIPPSPQPGYGAQTSAQTGYPLSVPSTQPSYGQPPQGQKPSPSRTVYGKAQQLPTSQAGYIQSAPVQPGYQTPPAPPVGYVQDSSLQRVPPSGFGTAGPQTGYGQQQPYVGGAPPSHPGYGQ